MSSRRPWNPFRVFDLGAQTTPAPAAVAIKDTLESHKYLALAFIASFLLGTMCSLISINKSDRYLGDVILDMPVNDYGERIYGDDTAADTSRNVLALSKSSKNSSMILVTIIFAQLIMIAILAAIAWKIDKRSVDKQSKQQKTSSFTNNI